LSTRGWALFAAASVIWGIPYLFIKIAVDEISPSVVAWSRLALAAAVLLPVAWKLGALRGLRERWRILTVFAAVEMAVPWPLLGFGEVHISSSLAAILVATVPLFVALLATRFDHSERPTATRLVGMLIGLAGVVALVGIDIGGKRDELLGALAILVVAFLYAIGPMIVKRRLSDVDPLGPVAASLGIADEVRAKVRNFPNGATSMREMAAATGHPIGCTQATEILATPGIRLVAPLPRGLDLETTYTAAVDARAADPGVARDFVARLTSPQGRAQRQALGFG